MSDERTCRGPVRIHAAELNYVDVADDGLRMTLRLRDLDGHHVSVSLPTDCLNSVLTAVPRRAAALLANHGDIHPVAGWSLDRTEQGLLLTLQLPDGVQITFALRPWQIAAIASLAGVEAGAPARRLN